jgi:hypothetical protein
MNIQPIEPEKNNLYYLGVFDVLKNVGTQEEELIEKIVTPTGSRVEDYFPLIVDCFNRRGNWKCLTTEDAKRIHHIDFCWSNATKITMKSSVHPRFLLDSIEHYISNKKAFYQKFRDHDFIPYFEDVNKDDILSKKELLREKFNNKKVIFKPNYGSISRGIIIQDKFNFKDAHKHIQKSKFSNWTISEITKSKLINDYIVTNRIYFLVMKTNDKDVKSYFYKTFMNYRAEKRFNGDITDHEQFLTNYMDKDDPLADEKFVKTRYIPHDEWLENFTEDQQAEIYSKLKNIFSVITDTLKDDLMSFNDNKLNYTVNGDCSHLCSSNILGFHIYGVDAIIDDDLNIKIIEMNGAPAINIKTRFYGLEDRLEYFDLMEEVFQKTVDTIIPPKIKQDEMNNFMQVYSGVKKSKGNIPTFYIAQSVTEHYPFILSALEKRNFLKRTKNLHDKIDFFYGLRERYVTDNTNMNYYDELLNFATSKRTRNASIINKVQGVTYYLANKARLYQKLLKIYSAENVHKFHPISSLIFLNGDNVIVNNGANNDANNGTSIDISSDVSSDISSDVRIDHYSSNNKSIRDKIKNIIESHPQILKWIVKPVHGSRGIGIEVFDLTPKKNFLKKNKNKKLSNYKDKIIDKIIEHMEYYCNHGFELIEKPLDKTFDGIQEEEVVYKKYKYWMICQYIDNPHLIKIGGDSFGRKYNIRMYGLINIKGHLTRYGNISEYNDPFDIIDLYIYNDFMVYCAMLEYNKKKISKAYKGIQKDKYFEKMKNLTNLEIINNVYDDLNGLNNGRYYNKEGAKSFFTDMFSTIYSKDSNMFKNVMEQAKDMMKKTVESVKYDLRPLNRHKDCYKGCFNLIAYDMMLDFNKKLYLIEVNRGPDIKGLLLNIGMHGCEKFFDEIFNITLDPHFEESKYQNTDTWTKIPIKY